MKYRLSSASCDDLNDAWLFIAHDNLQAADRFIDTVEDRLLLLSTHPEAGRKCEIPAPDLRSFPAGAYIIFYRIQPEYLEIVRILHGARDMETLFEEEEPES